MRRAILSLLVLAAFGCGGAAAIAAFTATTANPGNSFAAAGSFGGMRVATGTYTGNGADNRTIAVGFAADLVIVKGNNTQSAVARSSSVGGDLSKPLTGAVGVAPNLIQSITATAFTVGTDAQVNTNGTRYDWIAFRSYPQQMEQGLYTGNGSAQSITGLGFSPDYVLVAGAGTTAAVQRSSSMPGAYRFDPTAAAANGITALGTDGFSVGNSAETNTNGQTYAYIAWNAVHGLMSESSYNGNGVDGRNIGGANLQPDYVMVRSSTNGNNCDRGVHRPASLGGDSTLHFPNIANTANVIQALQANGFQVGNDCKVNTNGKPYYWMAFRTGS